MKNASNIRLAWALYEKNVPIVRIAKHCQKNRTTVQLWIKNIKKLGLSRFIKEYLQAKKGERKGRQIDNETKKLIWEIRRSENNHSGQNIQKLLKQRHDIKISVSKIYEILKEKYTIKSRWNKKE